MFLKLQYLIRLLSPRSNGWAPWSVGCSKCVLKGLQVMVLLRIFITIQHVIICPTGHTTLLLCLNFLYSHRSKIHTKNNMIIFMK